MSQLAKRLREQARLDAVGVGEVRVSLCEAANAIDLLRNIAYCLDRWGKLWNVPERFLESTRDALERVP